MAEDKKKEIDVTVIEVTEEYLKEALLCYKSKYGICTAVDNYIIYFEPFAVMKFVAAE